MEHFDCLLHDDVGRLRGKGAASDFISAFHMEMLGRQVAGCAVAVGDYESVLERRRRLNRHADFG